MSIQSVGYKVPPKGVEPTVPAPKGRLPLEKRTITDLFAYDLYHMGTMLLDKEKDQFPAQCKCISKKVKAFFDLFQKSYPFYKVLEPHVLEHLRQPGRRRQLAAVILYRFTELPQLVASGEPFAVTAYNDWGVARPIVGQGTRSWFALDTNIGGGKFKHVFLALDKNCQWKAWAEMAANNPDNLAEVEINKKLAPLVKLERCATILAAEHIHIPNEGGRITMISDYCEANLFEFSRNKEYSSLFQQKQQELVIDLVRAVAFLHQHGIIHRDLKPENILLKKKGDQEWQLKIIDFGFAIDMEAENTQKRLTKRCGSPHHMAPEVAIAPNFSAAYSQDIWSCAVLIEGILGRFPYFFTMFPDKPTWKDVVNVASFLTKVDKPCFGRLTTDPSFDRLLWGTSHPDPKKRWDTSRMLAEVEAIARSQQHTDQKEKE